MPSCLVLESIIQDLVYEGGNHHEDPLIPFTLTSSRIDSIRTSQHLVVLMPLSIVSVNTLKSVKRLKAVSNEECCNAFYT
jgi:hypothetical protein